MVCHIYAAALFHSQSELMREGSRRGSMRCFRVISKDVCLLSYVHMYVNNTGKKKNTEIGFSANVELFDLL